MHRILLLWFLVLVSLNPALASEGKEFEEDKLIGPTDLFTHDGYRSADHDSMYHIQLLVVEGSFSQADIGSGFLHGYQWYNSPALEDTTHDLLTIQIYRKDIDNVNSNYTGTYTLVHVTSLIAVGESFNNYFMYSAFALDPSHGSTEYIIAIMAQTNSVLPVMYRTDHCTNTNTVVLEASRAYSPSVGDTIMFTYGSVTCKSYSIQGMFVRTDFALPSSGCSMQVLPEDDHATISSPSDSSATSVCWIIRASYEPNILEVYQSSFNLRDSSGCSQESLQIEQFPSLTDYGNPDIVGRYCRQDLFDEKKMSENYIRLVYERSAYSSQYSFLITVSNVGEHHDDEYSFSWPGNWYNYTGIFLVPVIIAIVVGFKCFHYKMRMNYIQHQGRNAPVVYPNQAYAAGAMDNYPSSKYTGPVQPGYPTQVPPVSGGIAPIPPTNFGVDRAQPPLPPSYSAAVSAGDDGRSALPPLQGETRYWSVTQPTAATTEKQ